MNRQASVAADGEEELATGRFGDLMPFCLDRDLGPQLPLAIKQLRNHACECPDFIIVIWFISAYGPCLPSVSPSLLPPIRPRKYCRLIPTRRTPNAGFALACRRAVKAIDIIFRCTSVSMTFATRRLLSRYIHRVRLFHQCLSNNVSLFLLFSARLASLPCPTGYAAERWWEMSVRDRGKEWRGIRWWHSVWMDEVCVKLFSWSVRPSSVSFFRLQLFMRRCHHPRINMGMVHSSVPALDLPLRTRDYACIQSAKLTC